MKVTCCNQEMRAMGMWPTKMPGVVFKDRVGGGQESDGSTTPVDVFADRYHCLKCNSYIAVVEEPKRE
jgi:hypothetical protein